MSTEPVPSEVREYLLSSTGDRGEALRTVFETVHSAIPAGYTLGMSFGMPGWVLPLETYPTTYNKKPLAYVSLAAQKNYNSLYLLGTYSDPDAEREFTEAWATSGLKLDMGKSCLRFRTLDDVDLDIIARTVASTPVESFIAAYERARS